MPPAHCRSCRPLWSRPGSGDAGTASSSAATSPPAAPLAQSRVRRRMRGHSSTTPPAKPPGPCCCGWRGRATAAAPSVGGCRWTNWAWTALSVRRAWAVVETLVRRRLLAVDDGRLEVAHEALLTAWPRLAHWLAEDADGRRLRGHLSPAARDWEAKGRPAEDLYRGARLAAALTWAADHNDQLVAVERDFLAAAHATSDAELARERRARRRTRRLAAALAGALAVALLAGGLAVVQRERADERALAAERATLVADADRLAATAGTATDLDLSLLLATEAVRTADTPETQDGLLAAIVEHRQAVSLFRAPSDMRPNVPAVAGDGRQLHLLTDDHSLLSWDLTRGSSHTAAFHCACQPVRDSGLAGRRPRRDG